MLTSESIRYSPSQNRKAPCASRQAITQRTTHTTRGMPIIGSAPIKINYYLEDRIMIDISNATENQLDEILFGIELIMQGATAEEAIAALIERRANKVLPV